MSIDRSILKLRQRLQLETKTGYLGNGSGEVHDRRYPGRYYVRFAQAGGGYTAPVSITANPNANLPTTDGLPVDVGYDASGQMIIVRANVPGMTESGYNVLQLNPLDQQAEKLINQTQITTFYTTRHADLNNKPFYAVVFPGFLYINTTVTYFTGAEINLASLQPSSGDHCFAVVFIKNDATLEAFASTAINVSDPLATVDIQEAIDASTSGSQPLWAFEITGDDTALTVDPAHQVDLRAFVGGGVLGSGGGTVKSVALSASPAGVFDVSGSPITSSGTLALSLDSQAANTVLAGPTSGGAAAPGFRTWAHSENTGLTTGDDHTQYLLRQPTADWTIDASASYLGAVGGAVVAAQKLTVYTGADAIAGVVIVGNSTSQTANFLSAKIGGSTYFSVDHLGHISVGAGTGTSDNFALNVGKTFTDPSATTLGGRFQVTFNLTAASSRRMEALRGTASINQGGFNSTDNVVGVNGSAVAIGTSGTVSALIGNLITISNTGAGTVTSGYGIQIQSPINSGGGTLGTAYGIQIQNVTAGSTNIAIQTNAGNIVFNEGANNATSFRVETAGDQNIICTVPATDRVGFGTGAASTKVHALLTDAGTNTVVNVVTIGHDTNGTPAAGFGTGLIFEGESSTTASQSMGRLTYEWATATHASRKALAKWTVFDTAEREGIRIEASGAAPKLGFYGHASAAQSAAYTPSNVSTDRTYDANSTTVDELADVLGTLIADLQATGLIG